ncbi:MAG TPA: hypothetical protein VF895_01485 [Gaiellaceae bacterium]
MAIELSSTLSEVQLAGARSENGRGFALAHVIAPKSGQIAGATATQRRHGQELDRRRSIEMVLHPSIHLEIARQRHQDLLAEAERHRIAKAVDHAAATPTARRRQASRPASKRNRPSLDVKTGLEV